LPGRQHHDAHRSALARSRGDRERLQHREQPFFIVVLGITATAGLFFLAVAILFVKHGTLWFQVYMSSADVSMISLIGMGFRQVNSRVIVQGKIMATQGGLDINRMSGISTQRLEGHYLAGCNVELEAGTDR
jgi:uncharacterized protein YqfA (UPF0365 family)